MMYHPFIQPPSLVRSLYPKRLWRMDARERSLYLTFDDGPHPTITPFVLSQLANFNAKASFFCIGNRVAEYPFIYEKILESGHRVGNHTYQHLNAWKTSQSNYLNDVKRAAALIKSNLFRPPYGRLPWSYAKAIFKDMPADAQIVMWDVLSCDFDTQLDVTTCFRFCTQTIRPGSIIVLHDSQKAWDRLAGLLPLLLEFGIKNGYTFKSLP